MRAIKTVDIDNDLYETVKEQAYMRSMSIKEYVNDLLAKRNIREQFLKEFLPHLSTISCSDGIFYIKDHQNKTVAEVTLEGRILTCNICDSEHCMHVQYALASPELPTLVEKSIPKFKTTRAKESKKSIPI